MRQTRESYDTIRVNDDNSPVIAIEHFSPKEPFFDGGLFVLKRASLWFVENLIETSLDTMLTGCYISMTYDDKEDIGLFSRTTGENNFIQYVLGTVTKIGSTVSFTITRILQTGAVNYCNVNPSLFAKKNYTLIGGYIENKEWLTLQEESQRKCNNYLTFPENVFNTCP